MARNHSEVVFTLTQLFIASYNILTDAFGTAVQLPEAQALEIGFEADTDQIMAEGYLQHLLSVTTHATLKLGGAGVPFEALNILTGSTNTSSVASPNQVRRGKFGAGGAGLPYFAAVGKLVGEQGDDLWVGFPVCKLDKVPGWKAEQNKFVIQEAEGRAIKRTGATGYLAYLFGHETAVDIAAGNFHLAFA